MQWPRAGYKTCLAHQFYQTQLSISGIILGPYSTHDIQVAFPKTWEKWAKANRL